MIKICHVSDTHLRAFNPEPADILIHSGDALNYGNLNELIKFRDQLQPIHQNYKHIIFVPGNHDWPFEEDYSLASGILKEFIPNLHVLHNEIVELEGLKFYGTADQPEFCNWAFNRPPHELVESYAKIPDDIDVLITHCPPKGILDYVINKWNPVSKNVGSQELAYNLPRLKKLKAHCFGHIHFSRGLDKINDIWYSNGAMVDEQYLPGYKENIIELEV